MRKLFIILPVLVCTTFAAADIGDSPHGLDMVLNSYQQISYNGAPAWEYIYDGYFQMDDVSGGARREVNIYQLYLDFENADRILNIWTPDQGGNGHFYDSWTSVTAGNEIPYWLGGYYSSPIAPSYGDLATDNWIVDPGAATHIWNYDSDYTNTHGTDNIWHEPSEYMSPETGFTAGCAGELFDMDADGTNDRLHFRSFDSSTVSFTPELAMTFRIVHADGPYGEMSASFYGVGTRPAGTLVGPGGTAPQRDGDFTDDLGGGPDGFVDAYDIDALADAILNGGDVATFDLVIDGVLNSLDMDMLIASLVDTDLGLATGSFYGDFNLDGVVNLLDLNKLTANYNGLGGWTDGDANGDGSIQLLDLNKLTANYNNEVTVPEPATIFAMACGAAALIRRRRRA